MREWLKNIIREAFSEVLQTQTKKLEQLELKTTGCCFGARELPALDAFWEMRFPPDCEAIFSRPTGSRSFVICPKSDAPAMWVDGDNIKCHLRQYDETELYRQASSLLAEAASSASYKFEPTDDWEEYEVIDGRIVQIFREKAGPYLCTRLDDAGLVILDDRWVRFKSDA